MLSKRAILEHVDVDNLLHKRVLPSQTSTWANTSSLHKPVHQLFKHESCFGDFQLDNVWDVSNQPNGWWINHCCKTASNGSWWRRINCHWSWRGAKRLRKGPRGQRSHQQRWWGSHTSWQTRKRKWWLIWQWNCGMHGFDELEMYNWTWIDTNAMWHWLRC